jgi:chromosome segregation ATPase
MIHPAARRGGIDMGLARKLYEQIDAAADDRARFRLLVDAIGQLEEGWPHPGEIARAADVREAELRLQIELGGVRKEIEGVRKEIKEVELRLQGEIEGVRKEIKELELRLQREIDEVRKEIVQSKNDLLKWLVPLMFAQVVAIAALVKLL